MSSITHRSSTVGRWHTNRRTQTSSRVMDVDERSFHLHVAPLTPPADAPAPAKTWFFDVTERAHEGCQIGSYPFFAQGRVGANFVCRSVDANRLDACVAAVSAGLAALGFEPVEGGI